MNTRELIAAKSDLQRHWIARIMQATTPRERQDLLCQAKRDLAAAQFKIDDSRRRKSA